MQLTKHHGLSNDFLVLLDPDDEIVVDGVMARAMCDRRTGVGADGIIRATVVAEDALRMHLRNSDGSPAEVSGNGLRCLAQAAAMAGLTAGSELVIQTDAGPRAATVVPTERAEVHQVRVDMGTVVLGAEAPQWAGDGVAAARFADAGNPHLVLLVPDEDAGPDLVDIGEQANEAEGGINVELIRRDGRHDLDMAVFERGAGVTAACGSGACAAAVVARSWDLVGDVTSVHMPGGTAQVEIEDTVWLSGPTVAVAVVEWPHPGVVG
jgi:diaminopimelate epimerase